MKRKRYFVLFKSVDRGCGLELADSGGKLEKEWEDKKLS